MTQKARLPVPEMLLALLSPIRPVVALRAFRKLLADPDDTGQVFRMIRSLSGPHAAYLLHRFRRDPAGAWLLRERPMILPRLVDREALRALPAGSLGRAYLAFCESENITADGLVAASRAAEIPLDPAASDLAYIHHRLRDTHDLWHAVTGYRGDLVGEGGLLAFTFAQTGTPGIGLIVAGGWFKLAPHADRVQLREGFRRGWRAVWLPGVAWEELLDRPLEEVRRELRVGPPPTYVEVRTGATAAAA